MYKPATWCGSVCELQRFRRLPINAKGSLATRAHEGRAMAHDRGSHDRRNGPCMT